MRLALAAACFAFGVAAVAQVMVMGEASQGFVSLFNGQDIDRWKGDSASWSVSRGTILGTAGEEKRSLVYEGDRFRNFDFRFEVRRRKGTVTVLLRGEGRNALSVLLDSKPEEWTEYHVLCKAGLLAVTRDGVSISTEENQPQRSGWLGFELSDASRAEFRNIRVNKFD